MSESGPFSHSFAPFMYVTQKLGLPPTFDREAAAEQVMLALWRRVEALEKRVENDR